MVAGGGDQIAFRTATLRAMLEPEDRTRRGLDTLEQTDEHGREKSALNVG
jgi:hypothetical protein